MLILPHLNTILRADPRTGETLKAIRDAINQGHATVGVDPTGPYPTPTAPASLAVTATGGWFDAIITDANPQRGLSYFLDWSTDAAFSLPRTEYLGPGRSKYIQLGNQTLFWRCYSQYFGSNISAYTYFGTQANPTAVVGGGAAAPVPMPSGGTGAGPSAGASPFPPAGVGYGQLGSRAKLNTF